MKYCVKCGKQIADDAVYCNGCGASVVQDPIKVEIVKPQEKRPNALDVFGVLSLIVGIISTLFSPLMMFPIFGIYLIPVFFTASIFSIVFGAVGRKKAVGPGKCVAALVFGIITLLATIGFTAIQLSVIMAIFNPSNSVSALMIK